MGSTESAEQQTPVAQTPPNKPQLDLSSAVTETETFQKREYRVEKKIRVGCIGVGQRLAHLLRILLWNHGNIVQIVAISDESPVALQYAKKELAKHNPDLATYAEYQELIDRGDLDWVLIGSKNYLHARQCIAAFKANIHVFCEKPLATNIADGADILRAHKASARAFATGFVLRHAPLYTTVHKIVTEDKLLGKIITVEANETLYPGHGGYIFRNWRRHLDQSGPHILEKCCHDIDILNWVIDSLPTKVAAFGGLDIFKAENEPAPSILEHYETWMQAYEDVNPFTTEKTIEDNVVAILQYRSGVKATFHTNCNAAWPQRRLMICGLKGTLEANLITMEVSYQLIGGRRQKIEIKAPGAHGGGDDLIVEDLVQSMAEGTPPKASGEEGLRSAVVCLAIDEARRKSEIIDVEQYWKQVGV